MGNNLKLLLTPTTQKDLWIPSLIPTWSTTFIKDTEAIKSGFSPDSQLSQETEESSLEKPQNICPSVKCLSATRKTKLCFQNTFKEKSEHHDECSSSKTGDYGWISRLGQPVWTIGWVIGQCKTLCQKTKGNEIWVTAPQVALWAAHTWIHMHFTHRKK